MTDDEVLELAYRKAIKIEKFIEWKERHGSLEGLEDDG